VIDGNDPSSNASVIKAENMWYMWKQDITVPKQNVYMLIRYSAVFLYVLPLACQDFMCIIRLGK